MLTITTTYPSFDLEYYWPKAEITQKVSQVQIEGSGPSMEIDQVQSRNELGIGTYSYMARKIRDTSYNKVLEAITLMAQEGDEVVQRAGFFREEMIFADQAKRRLDAQIPELNITVAPRTRPTIKFHYQQEITWNQGGAIIKHQVHPPTITWEMGGVHVDVRG